MMKKDKIDDVLKNKLQDFEPNGDIPSWGEMRKRMVLAENALGERLVKPRRNVFLRYASIAALFIAAITIGLFIFVQDEEQPHKNNVVSTSAVKYIPDDEIQESRNEKLIDNLLASARKIVIKESEPPIQDGVYIATYQTTADQGSDISGGDDSVNGNSEQSESTGLSDDSPVSRYRGGSSYSSNGNPGRTLGDYGTQRRDGSHSWSAGAYYNGSNKTSSASNVAANSGFLSAAMNSLLIEMNSVANVFNVNRAMELKHKYPVSAGISVRKNLTKRFGLESGLVYTYLESNSDMNGTFDYKYRQKLHYLGIPLYASYSMLNSTKWDLYANAGVMVEFPVAARGVISIYEGDQLSSKTTSKLSNKGVVWSLGAHVGLGYDFVDNFGVYIEPGIGYYFENDNQPESYRTEHPLMFNLKAGFRFNF